MEGFGIELLDVRFKRINYNETVRRRIYERMVSERNQIADRFRSEGAGEAAKIMGKKEKDLQQIESEAHLMELYKLVNLTSNQMSILLFKVTSNKVVSTKLQIEKTPQLFLQMSKASKMESHLSK